MGTSKNLLEWRSEKSTSSREASPVSPSAVPGTAEAQMMTATSGRKCFESYEKRLPPGSLVKTLLASLLGTGVWYSRECSLIWRERVTKRGRLLFQLAPLTLRTGATEFGLLLTPTVVQTEESPEKMRARAERKGYDNGTRWGSLSSQIKFGFLPTPRVSDSEGGVVKNVVRSKEGRWSRENRKGVKFGVKVKDALGTTGRKLQPGFALWMMGYPENWLDLEDGEMPQSRARATLSSLKSPQK